MAAFEVQHPLGKDVELIHMVVSLGFVDPETVPEKNPNLKLNYEDPITSKVGIATLRIADWHTENQTAIYIPVAVDPADTTWQIMNEEGFAPVRQRIFTRDVLGRSFPLTMDGEQVESPYLQVDVIDDGVVFSVENAGAQKTAYAVYESEAYDIIERITKRHASLYALLELAKAA